MLNIPLRLFNKKSERSSEFVLLSSNAERKSDERRRQVSDGSDSGTFNHINRCGHRQLLNVMPIEWDGKIVYRRALDIVERKDWKDVKTHSKTVILDRL